MKIIQDMNKCVGCSACYAVCPVDAISMKLSEEGFLEPEVNDDKCIKCKKCIDICRTNTTVKNAESSNIFLAINKELEIVKESSSGGVFSAIAKEFINDEKGVVIGAAFTSDNELKHIEVSRVEELYKLRKSKYIQSDISEIFFRIDYNLKKNTKVLFTGTPCQVAAVKNVFKNNNLLFTCDIICHAVQSPGVFRTIIKNLEKKYNSKIKSINFRSKINGWTKPTTIITFDNNKKYMKYTGESCIGIGLVKNYATRKCCETCEYCATNRAGDLTLGDFWKAKYEANKQYIKKYGDIGFSTVLVNSEKGKELFNNILNNLIYEEKTIEDAITNNGPLYRPVKQSELRKEFFNDYNNLNFEVFEKKWLKLSFKEVIKSRIISLIYKTRINKIYRLIKRCRDYI